jgi:hypothetical protein
MAIEDWDPNEEPYVKRSRVLQVASVAHAAMAVALPAALSRGFPYTFLLFFLWPLWLYPLVKFRDGSQIGVVLAVVFSLVLLGTLLPTLLLLLALYLGARA